MVVAPRYGEGEAAGPTALAVAGAAGERARLGELEGAVLLRVRPRGGEHGAVAADRVAAGVGLRGGRVGGVDLYAEEAGIAVVIPEVQRSFYTDMRHGLPYFTYIAKELPDICHRLFRISDKREDRMIAGLSMGGYGALKTAMTFPEQYRAAASFSGVAELASFIDLHTPENRAIYDGRLGEENDLFALTAALAADKEREKPQLYITCGLSDALYEGNAHYRAHLDALGYPYTYEEWEGGHSWEFWDASLKKAIPLLLK